MLRDEIAISHEALDEHDVGQATDHLRSWLASRTTSSTRATFAHAAGPRPVKQRPVRLPRPARASVLRRLGPRRARRRRDPALRRRPRPYDRDLSDLVGELSTQSEEFRSHWVAQNVRLHDTGVKDYHHPVVGDITLTYNRLDLSADEGLKFTVWTAEPGSKNPPRRSTCSAAGRPPSTQRARPHEHSRLRGDLRHPAGKLPLQTYT